MKRFSAPSSSCPPGGSSNRCPTLQQTRTTRPSPAPSPPGLSSYQRGQPDEAPGRSPSVPRASLPVPARGREGETRKAGWADCFGVGPSVRSGSGADPFGRCDSCLPGRGVSNIQLRELRSGVVRREKSVLVHSTRPNFVCPDHARFSRLKSPRRARLSSSCEGAKHWGRSPLAPSQLLVLDWSHPKHGGHDVGVNGGPTDLLAFTGCSNCWVGRSWDGNGRALPPAQRLQPPSPSSPSLPIYLI